MDDEGYVKSNGFSIILIDAIRKTSKGTFEYMPNAHFDEDISYLLVRGRTKSSTGNYNKSDSYFSSNDHDNDGNLSEDEWLDAWKDYLNDKFDETGY